MESKIRLFPIIVTIILSILCLILGIVSWWFLLPLLVLLPILALGWWDLRQEKHSILHNYPILGHFRYLIEAFGPPLRQYVVENNKEGAPFNRDLRSLVYQRAKNIEAKKPFGTELDVYAPGYIWVNHSMVPAKVNHDLPRVTIGGDQCSQPFSASLLNISAMSFGSLSANAIMALNKGAALGNFYHTTGEGGISPYHRKFSGDLTWQIGSGYFGCRQADGSFCPDQFATQANIDQVKMIEIKLSQGAKPGHGGILPSVKITPEIATTRGIPMGQDCVSPSSHSSFSTPIELLNFIAKLRELAGGKPVGFKLCLGHPWEFLAICKAMLKTGIYPDFIVVDGGEGGTGAAPLEFSDHVGFPLVEGLSFVHNALVGVGLRDKIKIGASGKVASASRIAASLALGADWVNSARSFMFCLGCIQAQDCHTNHCPVGVATSDPELQRALNVDDKGERVANYHKNNLKMLNEITAAAGLDHPSAMLPRHLYIRHEGGSIKTFAELHHGLVHEELINNSDNPIFIRYWRMAQADTFSAKMG